jgi:hypothetical protein
VFGKSFGQDVITDWQDGFLLRDNDVISFEGLGLSMADLSITYSKGDAIVSIIGTTDQIVIQHVAVGSLDASDFVF